MTRSAVRSGAPLASAKGCQAELTQQELRVSLPADDKDRPMGVLLLPALGGVESLGLGRHLPQLPVECLQVCETLLLDLWGLGVTHGRGNLGWGTCTGADELSAIGLGRLRVGSTPPGKVFPASHAKRRIGSQMQD